MAAQTIPDVLDEPFLRQLADEIGADGVAEVIQAFLEDAPPRMRAIEGAMHERAIPVVRREAHALAGAARTIGLTHFGEAAYALQRSCEANGPYPDDVAALGLMLTDAVPVLVDWVDAALAE